MKSPLVAGLAAVLVTAVGPSPHLGDATSGRADVELTRASGAVQAAPGEECSDVLLLAVPGNGEAAGSVGSAGATLDLFIDSYRAAAAEGRRTVATKVVQVATEPAERLRIQPGADGPAIEQVSRRGLREWRGGIVATVDSLAHEVSTAAAACPDQQLVLAGYSQGAMAMHRLVRRLQRSPTVFERIAAAVLVSNGFRQPGSPRRLLGEPAASRDGRGVVTLFNTPPAPISDGTTSLRAWHVCARGDVVCDISRTPFQAALAAHRSYSTTSADVLRAIGRRTFARTSRWALPDVRQRTLDAQVGEPVQLQLGVRVRSADLPSVRWADVTGLPPGIAIDEHGLLAGSTSRAGQFQVTYTVANTVAPAFSRPSPGRLTLTVDPAPAEAQPISSGGDSSCFVQAGGTAWCWGDNRYGQLGNGTATGAREPVQVGSRRGWVSLSTSGASTCGIRTDGRAYCWGLNRWGELGDGTRVNRRRPVAVTDPGPWKSVVAGWFHTCGVKVDGSAWCWGRNEVGQLGDGTTAMRLVPSRVAGSGQWGSVAVGGWHTCGLNTDGSAWCWGRNHFGELALTGQVTRTTPQRVGPATDWAQLDLSWTHSCGVRTGGGIWCWGKNDKGQLGDGSRERRVNPVRVVGDRSYVQVSVGDSHSCGRATDGRVWCWGYGRYGQLGNGTQVDHVRTPVAAGGRWQTVDAGGYHACAVTVDGSKRCWGANIAGQLGDGTTKDRTTP